MQISCIIMEAWNIYRWHGSIQWNFRKIINRNCRTYKHWWYIAWIYENDLLDCKICVLSVFSFPVQIPAFYAKSCSLYAEFSMILSKGPGFHSVFPVWFRTCGHHPVQPPWMRVVLCTWSALRKYIRGVGGVRMGEFARGCKYFNMQHFETKWIKYCNWVWWRKHNWFYYTDNSTYYDHSKLLVSWLGRYSYFNNKQFKLVALKSLMMHLVGGDSFIKRWVKMYWP